MNNRKKLPDRDRCKIYTKYGGRCAYCGQPITYKEMQVEHREPLARGGLDGPENYMPSCRTCNHYKHTLTVEEFREQIGLLTGRLRERVYIYKLAYRHGRVIENEAPVKFFFETVGEYPDNDDILTAEQHSKLRELRAKLDEALDCEPADCSVEEEGIWKRANDIKVLLDGFFEEGSQ